MTIINFSRLSLLSSRNCLLFSKRYTSHSSTSTLNPLKKFNILFYENGDWCTKTLRALFSHPWLVEEVAIIRENGLGLFYIILNFF